MAQVETQASNKPDPHVAIAHATSVVKGMVEPAVLRTLMSFKVLQAIPTFGPITLSELESVTGVQASLLERLLRIAVSCDFIKHDPKAGTFSHTTTSQAYTTGLPEAFFCSVYDELISLMLLPEYYEKHEKREPDGDDATKSNPCTWRHGQEGQKTAFEIMEQDPEKLAKFQGVMGMIAHLRPYTGFYDYGKLAEGVESGRPVLVDVGGGDGKTIAEILKAYPELKPEQCVLQDREQVIELAKQSSTLPSDVQKQAHDFFQPQVVKGAKAYHLRAITHDWSDSTVVKILKNIVSAMAPDSKVLIADNVLPESEVDMMPAAMDLMMLCIGGKERNKKGFEKVLAEAGLRLESVWPAQGENSFAVVEAVLA